MPPRTSPQQARCTEYSYTSTRRKIRPIITTLNSYTCLHISSFA